VLSADLQASTGFNKWGSSDHHERVVRCQAAPLPPVQRSLEFIQRRRQHGNSSKIGPLPQRCRHGELSSLSAAVVVLSSKPFCARSWMQLRGGRQGHSDSTAVKSPVRDAKHACTKQGLQYSCRHEAPQSERRDRPASDPRVPRSITPSTPLRPPPQPPQPWDSALSTAHPLLG
jgi:hypothetical protein